jgi:flavin prenyltransferase
LRDARSPRLRFLEAGAIGIALFIMSQNEGKSIVLGVTGASGAIYAQALLCRLAADARVARVHLVVTETGLRLLAGELGIVTGDIKKLPGLLTGSAAANVESISHRDVGASIASGSYPVDAMIVAPCSAGTLASMASGVADDLLTRAADVCLKERRPLILCLRETPFNRVHLENMLRIHDAGALVMPAIPAFYFGPRTIDDLVEQYVCRVLAQAGLPQDNQFTWHGGQPPRPPQ